MNCLDMKSILSGVKEASVGSTSFPWLTLITTESVKVGFYSESRRLLGSFVKKLSTPSEQEAVAALEPNPTTTKIQSFSIMDALRTYHPACHRKEN